MKPLNESERDEVEAVKHLIKYCITKQDIPSYKLYDAILELNEIGQKFIAKGRGEEEIKEILEKDEMVELIDKFLYRIAHYVENGNDLIP